MDFSEARQRYRSAFAQFMSAYPRRVDHARAYDVFLGLILQGEDPRHLIAKAESYARTAGDMKYVPSPRTWLRDRRFNDEDLVVDQTVSMREWFARAYREADAAVVEKKYGFVYPDPPVPDGVGNIHDWHRDARKVWVGQIANHVLNGAPLPE